MRTTWLVDPEGLRVAVRPAGLLIGRAPHCDVVLTHEDASRVQAIAFDGAKSACLTVLGKGRTLVNGQPVSGDRELSDGDRIEMPGLTFRVEARSVEPSRPSSSWVLRGPRGLFGVVRTPFTVGASTSADLRLEHGPPELLRLHLTDRLLVEALVPIVVDGAPCEAGELRHAGPGAVLAHDAACLQVVAGGELGRESTARSEPVEPSHVRLEFLERGGRLTVKCPDRERTVYLPDRRCNLVATLLQPPRPYRPGELIPDEVVLGRVWPGRVSTRVELNVLLHRARHDLVRADLDGASLLVRADGGNATRFRLAPSADVTIE